MFLIFGATVLGLSMLSQPRRGALSMGRRLHAERSQGTRGGQLELPLFPEPPKLPPGVPSLWHTFEVRVDDSLYAVVMDDGYLLTVETSLEEARSDAEMTIDNDSHVRELQIIELSGVEINDLWDLLTHGTRDQAYDDGYAAMNVAAKYVKNDEPLWSFNIYEDVDFEDWPEDYQESQRENVLFDLPKVTIPAGRRMYFSTNTRDRFEVREDVEDWPFVVGTPDLSDATAHMLEDTEPPAFADPRIFVLRLGEDLDKVFVTRTEDETEYVEQLLLVDDWMDFEETVDKLVEFADKYDGWLIKAHTKRDGRFQPEVLILPPGVDVELIEVIEP